jgi:hypothetical protein
MFDTTLPHSQIKLIIKAISERRGSVVKILRSIGRPRAQTSARRPAILTKVFRDFPQSVEANSILVSYSRQYRLFHIHSKPLITDHLIIGR